MTVCWGQFTTNLSEVIKFDLGLTCHEEYIQFYSNKLKKYKTSLINIHV